MKNNKTQVFDQLEQGPIYIIMGKNTTRRIYTKPHSGLGWRIFHMLTSKDIDDFTDSMFNP